MATICACARSGASARPVWNGSKDGSENAPGIDLTMACISRGLDRGVLLQRPSEARGFPRPPVLLPQYPCMDAWHPDAWFRARWKRVEVVEMCKAELRVAVRSEIGGLLQRRSRLRCRSQRAVESRERLICFTFSKIEFALQVIEILLATGLIAPVRIAAGGIQGCL